MVNFPNSALYCAERRHLSRRSLLLLSLALTLPFGCGGGSEEATTQPGVTVEEEGTVRAAVRYVGGLPSPDPWWVIAGSKGIYACTLPSDFQIDGLGVHFKLVHEENPAIPPDYLGIPSTLLAIRRLT